MEEKILRFLETAESDEIKPFLNSLMSQNFDSFETFTAYLQQCQPNLSCNENWLTEQLIASCKNCGLFDNSCICIRCLLGGNHIQEKHQIFLQFGESGSCDCGQSVSWDPKGFCKKHIGQHGHPEESIPKEIRDNLNEIFDALKKFLIPEIENKTFHFFNEIFDFITSLPEMGDGVRRLASLSFGEDSFIQVIIENSYNFTSEISDLISSFISSYVNDESFSLQFARVVLPYCKFLVKNSLDFSHKRENNIENAPLCGPSSIMSLIFHVFHAFTMEKNVIDFNQYFENMMQIAIEFIRSNPKLFEGKNAGHFLGQFWVSKLILQFYIDRNKKDEAKQFIINISSNFSQIEGYIQPIQIINQFDDDTSYYDYFMMHSFTFEFSPFPFKLAKKIDYLPEIIEMFVDFLYRNDNLDHVSFLFLLHKLTIATLKNAEKPKEEFDKFIRNHPKFAEFGEKIKNKEDGFDEYENVFELIYIRACLIPINVITNVMLRDFNLLEKDMYPSSLLDALNKYKVSYYAQIDLPFLLPLIQFMLSFIEDKNKLLKLIELHLNIFDPKNIESKTKRLFCFMLIISALICDDPKFIGKKKRIVQLIFMTVLKNQPNIPTNYLTFYSASTELNRAMKWYKEVKFENNWHIILPFISPENLLRDHLPHILHDITIKSGQSKVKTNSNKNGSILLPFPDFVDSEIIDQRSIMKSTYLYAVLYDIMYETKEPLLYHYALNLFILLYKNEQIKNSKELTEERQINALNVDEIVRQMPNDNFLEFCDTKINYRRGGSYLSLIDLIENLGPLGMNTLNRVLHRRNKKEMKRIMKLKSNIKLIKSRIISNYKKNALNFNYMTVTNRATDIKLKPDDKMFIFVDFSISTIPDFLETRCHFNFNIKDEDKIDDEEEEEKEIFFSFMKKRQRLKRSYIINSCGHFTSEINENYVCPHCKTLFNFYLPNFNATNNPNLYANRIYESLNYFGNLKNCFKLLKCMIIILDFRSRLKPEVLQDEMIFLVYRNMFILSMLLMPGMDTSLFENRKSSLGNFLFDFIFTYNCDSNNFVQNFVKNYVDEKNYKIDYEFLKRIELIRLFFLNNKLELIVDIDEHFSFKNLIDMYMIPKESIVPTKYTKYQFYRAIYSSNEEEDEENVEKNEIVFDINEEELPAFRGIDLPENFLEIINDPFNIELASRKGEEKIICLATGEILNRSYTIQNMPIPRDLTYQPVLIADGPRINAIGIWRTNYFIFYKGIYKNNKGDEDVGFANGDPVFLDNESYIDLIDDFISGNCIKRIHNEKAEII